MEDHYDVKNDVSPSLLSNGIGSKSGFILMALASPAEAGIGHRHLYGDLHSKPG